MARGRKPIPTALKLITGNPGRRPLPEKEAKPALCMPTPPDFLSDEAKVEWGRVIDTLYNVGLMTELDRAALAAYCQAYGNWARAERQIAELRKGGDELGGVLVATDKGNLIQHPLFGIANKAKADVIRYAGEFGMTPAARSRVEAHEPEEKVSKAKKFFG